MMSFAKCALICLPLALAACGAGTSWNREAGDMDQGDFGNATMQNTLIATGSMMAPMGHDKYDAPAAGRKLSGKYAAVIGQTYITEAQRPHPVTATTGSQVDPSK